MVKRIQILLIVLSFASFGFAQKVNRIELSVSKEKSKRSELVQSNKERIVLKETLSHIDLVEKNTKDGSYVQIISEKLSKTFISGKPDIPVISRLIEIPLNCKVAIKILSYDEEIIELKTRNVIQQIIPAQRSVIKSKNPNDVPFQKDSKIYSKNEFFKRDIVTFEDKGYLRDKHLGYIEISPFEYNPVSNTLKVLNNIEIEISFIPDSKAKSINTVNLKSPYFNNLAPTINQVESTKALISGPVKYVIVSDRMFEAPLQAFIEWKTMKGFHVIEAYTDDLAVGNTTTSIKAYLQNLYTAPGDGIAPTFVLIVGDVAQVPAFNGTAGSEGGQATDLYYGEYSGDMLPDVFYGRFSANNVAELQPQIDKTLEVEKYEMPDPSYLNNVVLIAGVDGTYGPLHGNGFLNYASEYYINSSQGIIPKNYLYPVSGSSDEQIRNDISAGVSLANYTAHCNENGWANPGFSIINVESMTNEHMYPLMIGNCCLSNKFNVTCFGETLLRANKKGAVGYIGGSNNTMWDEDYWWAVGLSSIAINQTYENSGLGAYDRFFHLNGEDRENWYITQGQMIVAGNMAVEASASVDKDYYWEIYHLMGDPSLTPFVSVPSVLTASYPSEIILEASTLRVLTEPDAYVAISKGGVLLDARLADATGIVELSFGSLTELGVLDLVLTKQNRQPIIDQINVVTASSPYLILDQYIVDDVTENNNGEVDFGETIKLNVHLKNIPSAFDAYLVQASLTSADTNITITDSSESYGTILGSQTSAKEAFAVHFNNGFLDQQSVSFMLTMDFEDFSGNKYSHVADIVLIVNAPILKIGDLSIDDSAFNNDGILDPGETVKLKLSVTNKGSANINDVLGKLNSLTGSTLTTIGKGISDPFVLQAGEKKSIEFELTTDVSEVFNTPVDIEFKLYNEFIEFYTLTENKSILIGEPIPLLISEQGQHLIAEKGAFFYDSGGELGDYKNKENYTISFLPKNSTQKIIADFKLFNVESHVSCGYDKLMVYDSSKVDSSKLIGTYCATNSPGKIKATNAEGAITFVFTSDTYDVRSGWKAELSLSDSKCDVTFILVNSDNHPIENVNVNFNSEDKLTDGSGKAIYYDLTATKGLIYKLTKEGYNVLDGSVDIDKQDTTITKTMLLVKLIESKDEKGILVYPNPSNGILNLEMTNLIYDKISVKIYDVLGSVIYSNQFNGEQIKQKIDISKYAKGIYIMSLETNNGTITSKRILVK